MEAYEARVNITYKGQNGDLPDPVNFESTNGDVLGWAAEALRTGGIPGVTADPTANLTDFVVDRFTPTEARPYNLLQIRPKTPFGEALYEAALDTRTLELRLQDASMSEYYDELENLERN